MRNVLTVFLTLLTSVALSGSVLAADEGFRHHFGPFAGSSPDSGTCGNDWAKDTFKRFFTVSRASDSSFTLREDFKEGEFVTVAGDSPGGCETAAPHGSTVEAGIRGNFHGFLAGAVTSGIFDPNATCRAPCNGAKFLTAFFGPSAVWGVNTFKFNYHAEAPHLAFRNWQNASDDQGGNRGDIATH